MHLRASRAAELPLVRYEPRWRDQEAPLEFTSIASCRGHPSVIIGDSAGGLHVVSVDCDAYAAHLLEAKRRESNATAT